VKSALVIVILLNSFGLINNYKWYKQQLCLKFKVFTHWAMPARCACPGHPLLRGSIAYVPIAKGCLPQKFIWLYLARVYRPRVFETFLRGVPQMLCFVRVSSTHHNNLFYY
jgi:hypothetical protein